LIAAAELPLRPVPPPLLLLLLLLLPALTIGTSL
jgi:hypothetical protein